MSRGAYAGPKLPKFLLDQVDGGQGSQHGRQVPRKDRRKAERQLKKSNRSRPAVQHSPTNFSTAKRAKRNLAPTESDKEDSLSVEESFSDPEEKLGETQPKKVTLLNSSLKQSPSPRLPSKTVVEEGRGREWEDNDLSDDAVDDDDLYAESVQLHNKRSNSPNISRRAAKAGMAANDAEIAALERKLGAKSKRKDDDLDFLLGGLDSASEEEEGKLKRKRPEDNKWLRDKRVKATAADRADGKSSNDKIESNHIMNGVALDGEDNSEDPEDSFSEDELSDGDFEGFSDKDSSPVPKKTRENPYVAPITGDTPAVARYVPPSLRKVAASDEELLKRLRRQVQGQLNRLSEANILSILQSLEQIYQNNARHHVTSTLIDLLVALASDPSVLNDTFLILHAGFSAAVYKVIGTDFGAHLLERVVETFDRHRNGDASDGKQSLNLMAFLANLYSFQVVGSAIMFDYVRSLLDEISESNTELLLRVIRIAGSQLRQDDPSSLKDIVLLLQRNVTSVGEQNLSVRTKFMIETINNLKNNRMKTGATASAVTAEHTTRIKKTIGSLNSRSVKTTEPLRITLSDIRDSKKKGKWWLVGASFHDPARLVNGDETQSRKTPLKDEIDAGYESETPGHVSLQKLARTQGMNTDIRRAIFMCMMSASDFQDAHMRLQKLHLTSKQELEIPRILLNCAGSEQAYNPYYTLIAGKLCDETKMKKAFHFALRHVLGQLREQNDPEDADNEPSTNMSAKRIVNIGKLYGTLVADGSLNIGILKTMEFAHLSSQSHIFAEVFLTTTLLRVHRNGSESFSQGIKNIFAHTQAVPGMIQGIRYFIRTTLAKGDLASRKSERKAIAKACRMADESLVEAAEGAPMSNKDEEINADSE